MPCSADRSAWLLLFRMFPVAGGFLANDCDFDWLAFLNSLFDPALLSRTSSNHVMICPDELF
jgi:hypothetical protein